ncbi:MAG: T9SS type A sorting domain-containing protein [Bacteroidota bacterium]|nr:T9SS type A sorting domain-containing protein [Bacteroidota bacterium]
MKKLFTLTILLLVFAGLILAQTNTWKSATTNPNRGKWNTATNWSLNVVPTSSHDVVIPTIPVNQVFFPTLNGSNAVCKTLTIQSGASVTGAEALSLTVSGDGSVVGTLNASSSPINVSGNVTIDGSISYTAGRMNVTGTLTRNNLSGTGRKVLFSADNYIDITTSGITAITIQAFASTAPPNTPPEYDPTKGVNRYYSISNVVGTGEARPRFDYLAGEMGGSFTPSNANVWQQKIDAPWVNYGVLNAAAYYAEPLLPLHESDLLGDYSIADPEAALPVQLASFVANFVGDNVILEWQTVSEVNNFGFNVQRYNSNAKTYDNVGFVAGKGVPYTYTFLDENVNGSVEYRLEQIDNNGLKNYYGPIMLNPNGVNEDAVPAVFKLNQNYPNPFNPETIINYQLPIDNWVTIKVYDVLGREVAALVDEFKEAGYYSVEFNGSSLSSGVYFYKLVSGNYTAVKKLLITK